MSYEIIYEAFSVKQGDAVIPYTIAGSNNCSEFKCGRERKERRLGLLTWLYSNDLGEEVELQGRDVKTLLASNLAKEWDGGNITGMSLNAIIKRVSNIVLDNEILNIKTQINSAYYFEGTRAEKDKIDALINQYNALIDRILLKNEREEIKNKFIAELNDAELQSRFKDYVKDYFWHDELYSESILYQELAKLKHKRIAKEYNAEAIKDAMLKHGHIPTEADAGQRGFLSGYGEGSIKLLSEPTQKEFGVKIGFFMKGNKRRFVLIDNERFVSVKEIR